MAFNVIWESCDEPDTPLYAATAMMALNPKLIMLLGDDPYYNSGLSGYGYGTVPAISTASTAANVRDRVHQMWAKRGWRELKDRRDAGLMKVSWAGGDDHRWADNADHTVAQAETGGNPIGAPGTVTQAQVNAVATVWYDGHRLLANTYWDYPAAASMAANNGDVPAGPGLGGATMAATVFPTIYHYLDYDINGNLGGRHARIIVPDLVTYRSPLAATDNSGKTMLGVTQKAWFLSAAKSAYDAGFSHIIVGSSKMLYQGSGASRYGTGINTDTWSVYSTERDAVFSELHNYGVRPIVASGDRHSPQVTRGTVAAGQAFDSFDMCACPVSVVQNTGLSKLDQWVYARNTASRYESVFGSLEFADDGTLNMCMRDASSGRIRHQARFNPRSNAPIYT